MDEEDPILPSHGCCLCLPCLRPSSFSSSTPSLWRRGVLKVREWSELVAGPRWKTFIRRFNRSNNTQSSRFQYDPLSYALNFDEGLDPDSDGEGGGFQRGFSARFVATKEGGGVKAGS